VALRFGPEDEEGFYAASLALARRYEVVRGDGLGRVIEQILQHKWLYLDGDLTAWSRADVNTLLFDLYPAKSVLRPRDQDDVIRGFAGWLRFLAAEGLVADEVESERLAQLVELSSADFALATRDAVLVDAGKGISKKSGAYAAGKLNAS
jgi:hypothetical protein